MALANGIFVSAVGPADVDMAMLAEVMEAVDLDGLAKLKRLATKELE